MRIVVYLILCLLLHSMTGSGQFSVPQQFVGNWVNEKTSEWQYGFFEKFVIYENDFWDYSAIQVKGNSAAVTIKKGDQRRDIVMSFATSKDSLLSVRLNKKDIGRFKRMRRSFIPYPAVDDKRFNASEFRQDSVTIIGYYRNLDVYNKEAKTGQLKGPFKVALPGLFTERPTEYFADFDAEGRFRVTFPVINTQGVYLDWGRLTHRDVVEPGEEILLFADMADYVAVKALEELDDLKAWYDIPKQLIFMGSEARLHNELAYCKPSYELYDRSSNVNDTQTNNQLQKIQATYGKRVDHLQQYVDRYPTLSTRCREYRFTSEKYGMIKEVFGSLPSNQKNQAIASTLSTGSADTAFPFNEPQYFTMFNEYTEGVAQYFLNNEPSTRAVLIEEDRNNNALDNTWVFGGLSRLQHHELFSDRDREVIRRYVHFYSQVEPLIRLTTDPAVRRALRQPYLATLDAYAAIQRRPGVANLERNKAMEIARNSMEQFQIRLIRKIFADDKTRQVLIAGSIVKNMKHYHLPLTPVQSAALQENVSDPVILDFVSRINQEYIDLSASTAGVSSPGKTTHLKEYATADSLFTEIIAPYKGKLVYIDFWGTWCGPCINALPYSRKLIQQFGDKDVVFLFLANNSPEQSWKNVISKYNLNGKNVVHYNLPTEQQEMIERKFAINSFPSYLMFNKSGNLVADRAPSPTDQAGVAALINDLLAR